LQYGLVDRAILLGWPRSDIEVIDDDLGCSGATIAGRQGFSNAWSLKWVWIMSVWCWAWKCHGYQGHREIGINYWSLRDFQYTYWRFRRHL